MNSEQNSPDRRAARYAALADPVRLRILDALALGDVAPVELERALGVSSSLLAHHLKQLEREGFLRRRRSEADRRRSYLQSAPGAFDGLLWLPRLPAGRVLFVCTGNSARSQLAAALWRTVSEVPVASAGTHPAAAIEPGAVAAAERHGVALPDARPRGLDEVLARDDFVVSVCDAAHEELGARGRLHWSIADPVREGTEQAFDAAFEQLAQRTRGLAEILVASG